MMKNGIDLESMCNEVIQISKDTGQWILDQAENLQGEDVESKGLHNLVTYVDKGAEEQLVERLSKLLPGAGFLVEEETVSRKDEEYQWIVDPLDGTTNFIHGLPCFSISIALTHKGKAIIGVVYELNSKEVFYSWKGGKVFLNGKEISTSATSQMDDTLLSTGFPYYDYSRMQKYLDLFVYCLKNTRGVRRFGSAAVDLAYVACGRYDGFFEYSLNSWDVTAGAFLVEQAGGKVADFSGGDNYIFGREIVATNSFIFDEFMEVVKRSF